MLVLSRKVGEKIRIGDDVTVMVTLVHGKIVRLGIVAPRSTIVCRDELARAAAPDPGGTAGPPPPAGRDPAPEGP